jgi:hypothetical protein
MDGDDLAIGREAKEAVPDGILAFRTAEDEAVGFGKTATAGEIAKHILPSFPNDQDHVIDARTAIKPPPGVGDDRKSADLQE